MSETRTLLAETCNRLFADLVTPELLRAAEAGEWPAELWSALEDNGLTRALVPEDQGGAGLTWQDVYPILHAAGAHAAPVPLAETIVAGWLMAEAGMAVPAGVITIADDENTVRLSGGKGAWRASAKLENVPWGNDAAYLLAVARREQKKYFALLDRGSISARSDANIGREPRCAIEVADATPVAVAEVPNGLSIEPIRGFGALARASQMAGAIAATLDRSIRYAEDRVQFGRPLAKFQAIQHQLAVLATEAATAQIAAQFACRAIDVANAPSLAVHAIATAKIRAGEAAGKAAAIAHQVHGAIGFTDEYPLHYLTRRLWSWRAEYGAEAYWARALGGFFTRLGGDALWPLITSLANKDIGGAP